MEVALLVSFGLQLISALFVMALGIGVLVLVYFYIADVTQSKQAIRRNYPIIGRFRYMFEKQGVFFRQYFFSMDREEIPFNRAERSGVYRAAKATEIEIIMPSQWWRRIARQRMPHRAIYKSEHSPHRRKEYSHSLGQIRTFRAR